eukprot:c25253_g1_i1 orf=711-3452(+)
MSSAPSLESSKVAMVPSVKSITPAVADTIACEQAAVSQTLLDSNQSLLQQITSTMCIPASVTALGDNSPLSLSIEHGPIQESRGQSVKKMQEKTLQQSTKPLPHRPVSVLDDFKNLVPSGSAQKLALQQQALHQAALHQQSLKKLVLQSAASHETGSQKSQQLAAQQQLHSKHGAQPQTASSQSSLTQQASLLNYQAVIAAEPMDVDRMSQLDRASCSEQRDAPESGKKKGIEVESRASVSLGSMGEPKDSDHSERLQDKGEDSLISQACSRVHKAREGVFADLNAEPPVSEGEDAVPSEGLLPSVQPECSRSTPAEKRRRSKQSNDCNTLKDNEEYSKRAVKTGKLRPKVKVEIALDAGLDGDADSQLIGVPTTKEEKIKSLKVGLIHAARKMPRNAHAHFTLGLMHQRLGQPSKAAPAFQKAAEILRVEEEIGQSRAQFLSLVQTHYVQCLLQGVVCGKEFPGKELQLNDIENLVGKLKELVQADGVQVSIWNTLGLVLLRSGRLQSAISVFTSLLTAVPDYLDALANLGVAYLHSGNLEHAARCFQSLLEKDSSHPGALANYGALLLRQYGSTFSGVGAGAGQGAYTLRLGAAIAARQCLVAALKIDPKAGPVWVNLAAAYTVSGDLSSASRCLEQASKLEPTRMSTRYAVAMHRVQTSEQAHDPLEQLSWAANEMASILREGDPTTIQPCLAWAGLAMVNRAQHETAATFEGGEIDIQEVEERALYTLQQAIEENPEDSVQWHQLGLHALCTLQFREAQNYLKTAISKRQMCATAWSNLGIAVQLSEDPSLAEGVYKKALSFVAREQAHGIFSNLGNLYRQQKRFIDAHEAFKNALEICPDYAPVCNNLGLLLIAEGRWDDAISTFERALLADPLLDAAKSNKMKAEALAQIHRNDASHALSTAITRVT